MTIHEHVSQLWRMCVIRDGMAAAFNGGEDNLNLAFGRHEGYGQG